MSVMARDVKPPFAQMAKRSSTSGSPKNNLRKAKEVPSMPNTPKFDKPPFEVVSASSQTRHLNVLIYGPAGAGKTVLCGSAGEHPLSSPVLLLDAEAGSLSISAVLGSDVTKRVHVKRIIDFEKDMNEVYEYLADKKHPYKTVILDSGSELQRLCMQGIMRKAINERPDRDPDVPDLRDWMKNSERMRRTIRAFRDLPIHFVMTCLAHSMKNERTGAISILPALPGKQAEEATGYFDIVGYMVNKTDDKGEKKRVLYVQPSGSNFAAKDRTDTLGAYMVNPTFSEMLGRIVGDSDK